jgi:hypothetical protein
MKKLVCQACGEEIKVPVCCDKSMVLEDNYLICCCSSDCAHQQIPKCSSCGKTMTYCY